MKSFNEIVWSVIEYVSGFHVTDDNPFDPELIGQKVHDVRETLIRQNYHQFKKIDDAFYQFFEVNIEDAAINKSGDVELKQFFVTFPELVVGVGWENIKYLGKKDMLEKYNRRSMDGFNARKGRFWSRNMVEYTLVGSSRAIIHNEKLAEDINMLALVKNPLSVPGMDGDKPYPTPDSHKLEMIVKQDIFPSLGIKPDEKNDSRHNWEEIQGR